MSTRDVQDHGRTQDRKPARAARRWAGVGVVVVLVGAIAVVNLPGGEGRADPPAATDEAPLGEGFPHTKAGAESAASSYAALLGGEKMFNEEDRHQVVQAVTDSAVRDELQAAMDQDYTAAFNKKLGLDAGGRPPAGTDFVSQTTAVEAIARAYGPKAARIEVWCSGRLGLTGKKTDRPVTTTWFTMTLQLAWSAGDWKVRELSQRSGPVPQQ